MNNVPKPISEVKGSYIKFKNGSKTTFTPRHQTFKIIEPFIFTNVVDKPRRHAILKDLVTEVSAYEAAKE